MKFIKLLLNIIYIEEVSIAKDAVEINIIVQIFE